MKRSLIAACLALFVVQCGPEPRVYRDAAFPPSVAVAPLAEALTFARNEVNGQPQVLAVGAYEGESVTAYNLTQALGAHLDDPVTLFNEFGYDALRSRIETGLREEAVVVPVADLILPLQLGASHIAAGTNFAAHAEESSVEDGPFLFAKIVTPTPFNASVSAGDALLDYEVELAFVTLSDAELPEVPEYMGVVLSNDFTDRAALMRHVNPDDVTSGDGFTTGKSAEGYLPIGNLLVIPRNLEAFVAGIDLRLAVNGKLRQEANMELAIWDVRELMQQIQTRENRRWMHMGEEVSLPIDNGAIPARTLILAGTPEGTVFSGVPNGAIAGGIFRWAAGGWGESVTTHAIESYIATAKKNGEYLQPSDVVLIHVDRLGVIETRVD